MADGKSQTTARVQQITIECVREDDGSLGWVWDAWPLIPLPHERAVASGAASTLKDCLDSMREALGV